MTFDSAQQVESIVWQLKMSDYLRSANRARINNLFNGFPPYTPEEVTANNININVNDLESTRLAHDARAQFYQGFLKPGAFFKCHLDNGPKHKRQMRSAIVTGELSKLMKRSLPYFETMRSKFALAVLHGISPCAFKNSYSWCPEPIAVDDVMVPANTLLVMNNLPFFAVWRSFTAPELVKLTQGIKVDPGWNKKMVKECLRYLDTQTQSLMSDNWPQVWSPEKAEERVKQSSGSYYLGDAVPTIKAWDVYYWDDAGDVQGWRRRMVLDAWSQPVLTNSVVTSNRIKELEGIAGDFLFNPGNKIWASDRSEIINWQFADLSAVAPFNYHSVRSIGFLLYAICHLQNRLRCRFNEAAFEHMMQLFRVKSEEDMQRVLKVDLINKGFVDPTVDFIKNEERHQVDTQLAEFALRQNQDLISRHASSYTPQGAPQTQGPEKTKFQVMTEVQAMTSLVSAAFLQAYTYQAVEYREIFRRFCKKDSRDPDVRTFQANCKRKGVPLDMLCPEYFDIEPERTMGAGNKTLEVAIANQLLAMRNLFDPEPQRDILRLATLSITDDPALAQSLVPEDPNPVTDAKLIASLAAGPLMMGLQVPIKTGINHIDYVETLLTDLSGLVKKYQNQVPPPEDIIGMNNMSQHIKQHIQVIAQDPNEKSRVKQYMDALSKMDNEIRAYAQRAQQQQQEQAAQNGNGQDAETQAKIKAMLITAEAKADAQREAHSQRTAERQIQFELEQQRKQKEWELEMQRDISLKGQEMIHTEHEHTQEMRHEVAKGRMEIAKEKAKAEAAKKTAAAKSKSKPT